MGIKRFLTKLVEKLTHRKCTRCKYNRAGRCTHPSDSMFMKCWHSITRPGWTGKFQKAPAPVDHTATGKALCDGYLDGIQATKERNDQRDKEMTEEEKYQLQKIRESLAMAEDMARESGLISED